MSRQPPPIYLFESHRMVWVPIAKAGCTSLRHVFAQLAGRPLMAAEHSSAPEMSEDMLIHDPHVNGLTSLDRARKGARRAAMNDPSWWRFAVVRSPHRRFLSAWVDKVFLRYPCNAHLWEGTSDVRTSDGQIDLTATFRAFVDQFARAPDRFVADRHFAPQHETLQRSGLPDLEVVPFSRISELVSRISDRVGHSCELRRSNESIPVDASRLYDSAAAHVIASVYRKDVNMDPADPPPTPIPGDHVVLTLRESALVQRLRAAACRVEQLSRIATPPRVLRWLRSMVTIW